MRVRLLAAAVPAALCTLLAALAPPATAAPAASALPGQVCFWTQPGQMGESWCYGPPGYAEVPPPMKRNAHSFRSDLNASVFAISWTKWGCVYREIRAYDYSEKWEWADKLDGVDSAVPADCQQG